MARITSCARLLTARCARNAATVTPRLAAHSALPTRRSSPTPTKQIMNAKYWNRPLARPIALKGGSELVTLKDAGLFIRDYFQGYTKNDCLEWAVELLMIAAASGKLKDRQRATDQIVILIGSRPWLLKHS